MKDKIFIISRKRNQKEQSLIIDDIPLIDIINWRDIKTGLIKEKKIRYIPGAPSIFADEQPIYYDSEWEKKEMRPKSLQIHNGSIRISPTQTLLMDFFTLCNYNQSNPSRRLDKEALFYELDIEATAKKKNRERDERIDAENRVRTMDKNELRAHLVTISNMGTLAAIDNIRNMEEEQLRDQAYNLASKNPSTFLKSFSNPANNSKYVIINALLRDIITYNEQSQTISWKSSGDVIMTSANGMNAIDALAEFSVTSEKHKQAVEDMKSKMIDRMGTNEKKSAELPPIIKDDRDIVDITIDKCIDAGVISNTFPWFVINKREDAPSDEDSIKLQGRKNLRKYIVDNGMVADLIERVQK